MSLKRTAVITALLAVCGVAAPAVAGWGPKVRIGNPVDTVSETASRAAEALKKKERAIREKAERFAAAAAKERQRAAKALAEKRRRTREALELVATGVSEAPGKMAASVAAEVKNGTEYVEDRSATASRAISAETRTALNVRNWEEWMACPSATALSAVSRCEKSVQVEVGNGVDFLKSQWWYQGFQEHLLDLLIEEPEFEVCGEDFPGPPVWYVNGIFTTKSAAVKAGNAMANRLQRRIHVLHNRTSIEAPYHTGLDAMGFVPDDISEACYDRAWPALVVSKLGTLTEPTLAALAATSEKLQGNRATRQLTYIIYHSKEPVSLVTHSQGSLIARNAFFSCFLLGKESKARNKVAWVAAGLPLDDNEIFPAPKRMTILPYDDDPVAKWVGVRGGGVELNAADHGFRENYLELLNPAQLWPAPANVSSDVAAK